MIVPPGVEQHLHAGDEVVEIRNVGEHVVAEQEIGALLGRAPPSAVATPKNSTRVGIPGSPARPRRRWRRARCRARESRARESTAAGSRRWRRSRRRWLLGAEVEAPDHLLHVARAMLEPARRERGEVGVVGEDARPGSRTARAAPAGSSRRRRHAAGRTAPSRWPARRRGSCWRAASCRGRRTRARGAPRRSGRGRHRVQPTGRGSGFTLRSGVASRRRRGRRGPRSQAPRRLDSSVRSSRSARR